LKSSSFKMAFTTIKGGERFSRGLITRCYV
jgi:hypothetical protein